mgnify:CR=1 FL=1
MRHLIIVTLMVMLTCHAYGQTYSSHTTDREQTATAYHFDYKQTDEWRKYKIMRAVGWSALGASVPLVFFGVAFTGFSSMYNDQDLQALGLGLLIPGGTLLVGSIPVLICAYNYRNKARNMSFGVSAVHTPGLNGGSMAYTPALSVSLSF